MLASLVVLGLCHTVTGLNTARQPLPVAMRLRGGAVQAVAATKLPGETYHALADKGAANAKAPLPKALHQAIMGGMYVAIGGVFALTVAGAMSHLGLAISCGVHGYGPEGKLICIWDAL